MDQEEFDKNIRARGVTLKSFAIESVTLDEESKKKIDKYELGGDAYQQQGTLTESYAKAVENASQNESGFAEGFMGIGVMNMATGNVFGNTTANTANAINMNNANMGVAGVAGTQAQPNSWKCSCGAVNTAKFCQECGLPKEKVCPKCNTANPNDAKFCQECGEKI